jgi:hypothetical protein
VTTKIVLTAERSWISPRELEIIIKQGVEIDGMIQGLVSEFSREVYNLRDKAIHAGLIELGWTLPARTWCSARASSRQEISTEDQMTIYEAEEYLIRILIPNACMNRTSNGAPWCLPCTLPKNHSGPCLFDYKLLREAREKQDRLEIK